MAAMSGIHVYKPTLIQLHTNMTEFIGTRESKKCTDIINII